MHNTRNLLREARDTIEWLTAPAKEREHLPMPTTDIISKIDAFLKDESNA